ncbi:ATP-binding protein [Pararobbsia alpina]|uniref:hybrid sensor histidine kinase/response regulator n=1 Tax=Pararobbsia alpina TaxID=621374 RepID=UPI0039A5B946
MTSLREGAACALIADEALDRKALDLLEAWLINQQPWSDLPFVLLVGNGKRGMPTPESLHLATLGNVVLIERPVSRDALISAARSALRARRRQYQAREMIAERAAANAQLLIASRQKDEFLAMLAHELRNPLTPIRNAVETIRVAEEALPPRMHWARDIIERQTRHLSSLLEALLDVSRITTGKVTLRQETLDLGVLLANAIDVARLSIAARRHVLEADLPDESMYVSADATRLAQVFGNLLDNAAKYTPDGGRIRVQAHKEGSEAVVTISDNGTGISKDDLPRIFELFSQSSRALDRAQGGLGIGLSIVRTLVAMHGGNVEAHSDGIGQGASVVLHLPLVLARQEELASPSRSRPRHTQGLRILVVDDNSDAAESLAILLGVGGHDAVTAPDGPIALAKCETERFDAVILDIGLPGLDGYEVARRMKLLPSMSGVMLIALTGYGQVEDIRHAKEAGFNHHFVKPVEPDSLFALFDEMSA